MASKGKNIFTKLLLLFTIVPIAELLLLFKITQYTNVIITITIIITTGIVGAYLAKKEGRGILSRIKLDISEGRLPAEELINGLCVLIGAAMLLTPGIITDLTGFTLLIPVTRNLYKSYLKGMFARMIDNGNMRIYIR